MKIAIHQPNYIPYPGFFDKIKQSDGFVLFDDVQYTKGGYQNRTKIINSKVSEGWSWLSVPVENPSFKITKEVKICYETNWQTIHVNKIKNLIDENSNEDLFNKIQNEVVRKNKYLIDLTIPIIYLIIQHLNIKTNVFISSELVPDKKSLNATEKIISLCEKLNARGYLSGISGEKYLQKEMFSERGIDLNIANQTRRYDFLCRNENKFNDFSCSILNYL